MVLAVEGWDVPGTGLTREKVQGGGLDQDQKETLFGGRGGNINRGGNLGWDSHLSI